jgi:uncharacterized hydantoinase/oxoprolinase family protein
MERVHIFEIQVYKNMLRTKISKILNRIKIPKFQIDISNGCFFSNASKKAIGRAKLETKLTLQVKLFF